MRIARVTGVLCCGNICHDIPVWPVDQFTWGTTTFVAELEAGIGGNGANTSYTLGRLDCPVKVYGIVGRDWQGDNLIGILQKAGVNTDGVERTGAPTNSTVCVVNSTGDRLFLHRLGASSDMRAVNLQVGSPQAAPYSHFHMANFFTLPDIRKHAQEILAEARSAGKTTSLDTGWDGMGRWMEDVGPCLPYVDLMFVNDTEARVLTGFEDSAQAAAKLRDLGAGEVIVKLGGSGSVLFAGDGTHHAAPFSVKPVDTTGAGDCFAGGFLAALHHGMPYAEALRFANAVGALNVQKLGAVTGIIGFEETLAWMSSAVHLN